VAFGDRAVAGPRPRRALHDHPEWRRRIADGDQEALSAFAQEVRRLYPFVPVLAARARRRQDVLGVDVPRGGLVVLDVSPARRSPSPRRTSATTCPDPAPQRGVLLQPVPTAEEDVQAAGQAHDQG
jgi:hypothetical protein